MSTPFWQERTGLRRRLEEPPPTAPDPAPGQDIAEWLATFEISEPLGRMYDLLVSEE